MLVPSDINYYDLDTIAAYSGKGWPVGDYFKEDLLESYATVLAALDKASKQG